MTNRPVVHDPLDNEREMREIKQIFAELEAAFDEHDAAKFDSRFTSDVVFTAVNGRRFHGWDEIHNYHRDRLTHHAGDIRTWYEIDRIDFPVPTVAVVFLRQPMTTRHDQRANIGTWVLTKNDDTWWICAAQNTGIAKT